MKLQSLTLVYRIWRCGLRSHLHRVTRSAIALYLASGIGTLSIITHTLTLPPVIAAPATTVAEPTLAPADTIIMQKLAGQWLTREPLMGNMAIFVFGPNGEAFLISGEAPNGKALARRIHYRINANPKPMHIDIVLNRNTIVQTVFEFTPAGDLRLQMVNASPQEPRPTALTEDATLFQRISDATTLPPDTLLINPTGGTGNNR